MTQEEYLKRFEEKCQAEIELTRKKNADYAGVENAFKNFELIEYLTGNRITAAEGLLVRMSDKLIRFANLLSRAAQVKDETITDTLDDLSVYAKITSIVLEEKSEEGPNPNAMWQQGMNAAQPVIVEEEQSIPNNLYEQIMRRLREAA